MTEGELYVWDDGRFRLPKSGEVERNGFVPSADLARLAERFEALSSAAVGLVVLATTVDDRLWPKPDWPAIRRAAKAVYDATMATPPASAPTESRDSDANDALPQALHYCVICKWSGASGSCPNCNGDRGFREYYVPVSRATQAEASLLEAHDALSWLAACQDDFTIHSESGERCQLYRAFNDEDSTHHYADNPIEALVGLARKMGWPGLPASTPEMKDHPHDGMGGGDEDGYDMTGASGPTTHRDVRNFLQVHSPRLGATATAQLMAYIDKATQAEARVVELETERDAAEAQADQQRDRRKLVERQLSDLASFLAEHGEGKTEPPATAQSEAKADECDAPKHGCYDQHWLTRPIYCPPRASVAEARDQFHAPAPPAESSFSTAAEEKCWLDALKLLEDQGANVQDMLNQAAENVEKYGKGPPAEAAQPEVTPSHWLSRAWRHHEQSREQRGVRDGSQLTHDDHAFIELWHAVRELESRPPAPAEGLVSRAELVAALRQVGYRRPGSYGDASSEHLNELAEKLSKGAR